MAIQKSRITASVTGRKPGAENASSQAQNTQRYVIVGLLVVASFFGAYKYAQAQGGASVSALTTGAAAGGVAPASGAGAAASAGGGGGCCGGGGGAPTTGAATVQGGVQKIAIDASSGYKPNTIQLKAGIPAELTFSQSSGCTGVVQSADLGFQEDLSGGPKTVKLQGLKPGTYNFACGMNMVRGQIVVQ